MPYVTGRLIHDADSHLMELPDCLDPWFEKRLLGRFHDLPYYQRKLGKAGWAQSARERHADPKFLADADDQILLRKNYDALGAFLKQDRTQALDALGFASQLVFTTFCLNNFDLNGGDDLELAYAAATAHNRMMTDFCAVDRRLLATAYIPLEDFDMSRACAATAIQLGAKALLIPSKPPRHHSPSHIGLDPVWAMAAERGIPILFQQWQTQGQGFPRRRGELHLGQLHADPAGRDDHSGGNDF